MMVIKKIKYMLTGIIASLAMTSYAQEQQFESTPTWSEEFNYEGRPDSLKWEFDYGTGQHGWGNNELQYYVNTAQNIMVSNGTLKIHAIHEATNGMAYSSSKIKTLGKNGFKYGRIEVSAKVPPQVGTWPAVWMMPVHSTYGGWPRSGEIDIIEHVGYDPKQLHITVHTLDYNGMNNNQKGSNTYVEKAISEFNTYRIDWTEEGITGYINDKKVYEYPNTGKGYTSWPFDQEFYLIVNLAVGGDWGGRKGVENETFPATFEVDYIRYYPLKSK